MHAPWLTRVAFRAGYRWWNDDNCPQIASSLAYQTALALVPLLAVAFALLKATGQLDAQSALLQFLGTQILPSSEDTRQEIIQRLASFTSNVGAGALGGGVALLITLVTSFTLFLNVEAIWNRIWSATRRRSFLRKFLLFYAAITLGPFALGLSLFYTTAFRSRLSVGPLLMTALSTPLALTLANWALPLTRMRWRSALLGGVSSGALFELAKFGFGVYLAWATTSYRTIYGALGILPLFLFWIYLAWSIVLFGAELAHAAERLEVLEAAARREAETALSQAEIGASGPLAARLLLDVARHYRDGGGALPAAVLETRHALSEELVRRVMRRLEQRWLVIASDEAYLPARPAETIPLEEVLEAFAPPRDLAEGDDRLGRLMHELIELRRERTGALTLGDLL